MAEAEDRSQKTEEPTHKKLEDARKKAQVASSREVNHWFMIFAGAIVLLLSPTMLGDLPRLLAAFLANAHDIATDRASLAWLGAETVSGVATLMAPVAAIFVAAAVASGVLQHGPIASVAKLKPKLENISLIKGLKRLFALRSIVEFVKGVIKLAIVAAVATALVAPEIERLAGAAALQPPQILDLVWSLALRLIGGVCAVVAVIAGLDFLYQKFEFHKSMRMSKQEIKDELKQTDGDPAIKARLRQLRLERARRRMISAVPEADVVITNPTHFAVALKYDQAAMAAPRLVAKGVDAIARRIREVAEEHDVPVVENPPLAQALHAGVEIDAEIPETHFRAVAEVIGYVWRLKGKMPRRQAV